MADRHRVAIENARRLAGLVAKERAESIRQQIAAANTALTLADIELQQGRVDRSKILLQRTRGVAEKVRFHLGEPNHVPSTEGEELSVSLERLERKIKTLARKLDTKRGSR